VLVVGTEDGVEQRQLQVQPGGAEGKGAQVLGQA